MVPQWIIEKKRDGLRLSDEELRFFIEGFTRGDIPDYQMAAMAMAIYFKGMTLDEMAVLTDVIMRSGDLVDTSSIEAPKVDKHSTGGIGDKVSLLLAPLVACCGLAVPMISGRGLGITGGTLDKLEAIPGYKTDLDEAAFISVIQKCGCSIIGQTGEIAPADKKLYALGDVTATVPSIPLIVASIMSKKLAAGLDGLVLDVKWGKGAFMKSQDQARELAANMVEVGVRMGKGMAALITDMNQPLGHTAGNALEIMETAEALRGEGRDDLMEITMSLSARMLVLAGKAATPVEALGLLQKPLKSGAAYEKFKEMVELQGGDPGSIDDPSKLPQAKHKEVIKAKCSGYVAAVDADKVGRAVLLLGAGRTKTDDIIDPAVGVSDLIKVGTVVETGAKLLTIHANKTEHMDEVENLLGEAISITEGVAYSAALVNEVLLPKGLKR